MTLPLAFTPVDDLPAGPTRADPKNFARRGDETMTALPKFGTQMNTLAAQVMAAIGTVMSQVGADNAASVAAAQAAAQAAMTAWAASMTPAETLPAIAASIHSGAIVRAIIYDTSRDSDGGAWRRRCRHTSWYNETVTLGVWRGQRASEAACRAVAGAATGDYYQHTGDGRFYSLNAGAGQTEVFRGNVRDFPALAAVVLEVGRVVIYDLTQSGAPMWMVFYKGTASWTAGNLGIVDVSATAVAALNGELFIASNATGLARVNFVRDSGYVVSSASSGGNYLGNVGQRNAGKGFSNDVAAGGRIVSGDVSDVAASALPGAPTDFATGLPVSTVAVATANGACVLKQDGSISAVTPAIYSHKAVVIDARGGLWSVDYSNGTLGYYGDIPSMGAAITAKRTFFRAPASIPATIGAYVPPFARAAIAGGAVAVGSVAGLTLLKPQLAALANSAVAYICDTYNSGWLVGDMRGAWLADAVAEMVAGSGELISNGNFTSNIAGWSPASTGGNPTWASGQMLVTGTAAAVVQGAVIPIACVPGKSYRLTCELVNASGTNRYLRIGTGNNPNLGGSVAVLDNTAFGIGANTLNFVATQATHYVHCSVYNTGDTITIDNVSARLVAPDRSVKNSGMDVNGTLSKVAVAAGAQLCAWSGWSSSNYLEQPYSANLDFGTGDFHVMGWVNPAHLAASQYLFARENSGQTAQRIYAWHDATTGQVNFRVTDGTTVAQPAGGAVIAGQPNLVSCVKSGSTLYVYVNDKQVASAAAPTLTLSNATALFRLGVSGGPATAAQSGWMALWRAGATALNADQIAQIYRDELALFQPGAQCTMAGANAAVTALAYDDGTDLLHVGSSWGRGAFKGLQRVEAEATGVGSVTALSSSQGMLLQGGATGGRYTQAAMLLRDLLSKPRLGRLAGLDRQPASRSPRAGNVQLTAADHGRLVDVTTGTFTQTADTADLLGADWWVIYRNSGSGIVTMPMADGVVKPLGPGRACLLSCDGATLATVPFGRTAGALHVQERYASTAFGPALLDNGVQARAQNTTVSNSVPGATVAGGQVTLPAGEYDVSGWAGAYCNSSVTGRHRCWLMNVTDLTAVLLGSSASVSYNNTTQSTFSGRISISSTKVFELRSFSLSGASGTLWTGGGVGSGLAEVCSELYIKEA